MARRKRCKNCQELIDGHLCPYCGYTNHNGYKKVDRAEKIPSIIHRGTTIDTKKVRDASDYWTPEDKRANVYLIASVLLTIFGLFPLFFTINHIISLILSTKYLKEEFKLYAKWIKVIRIINIIYLGFSALIIVPDIIMFIFST